MKIKESNPKLDMVLAEIKRCEEAAIANRSYDMPTHKEICNTLGIGRTYFKSGTEPARTATAAFDLAQERLEALASANEPMSSRDTKLERCCSCLELRLPVLTRPVTVYDRPTVQHFCSTCLKKQSITKSEKKAA